MMRTHELARVLQGLSRLLLAQPDKDLANIGSSAIRTRRARSTDRHRRQLRFEQLTQVLSLTKPQLREIVQRFDLPIAITDRNSSRDILGRLIVLFRKRPDLVERIRNNTVHARKDANPQLQAALELLLGPEQ